MRELEDKNISIKAQFEYAWCLIRSNYAVDINKVSTNWLIDSVNLSNLNFAGNRFVWGFMHQKCGG